MVLINVLIMVDILFFKCSSDNPIVFNNSTVKFGRTPSRKNCERKKIKVIQRHNKGKKGKNKKKNERTKIDKLINKI